MMRIRESDMPDEAEWVTYLSPVRMLTTLGMSDRVHDVADFGCGYGTFAIPAARMISGTVYAIDVDRDIVDVITAKVHHARLGNVRVMQRDLLDEDSG
jgi:predicted RNA methylase